MSPPVVVDSKKILNLRAKSYAHYIGPCWRDWTPRARSTSAARCAWSGAFAAYRRCAPTFARCCREVMR